MDADDTPGLRMQQAVIHDRIARLVPGPNLGQEESDCDAAESHTRLPWVRLACVWDECRGGSA
jgi:hypothetical protein